MKMEKITFYNLTIEGHQELILATIKKLQWELDCIREQLGEVPEYSDKVNNEINTVIAELEGEEFVIEEKLKKEQRRLILLRGCDSDGIPF
jgi:hypothetical protein